MIPLIAAGIVGGAALISGVIQGVSSYAASQAQSKSADKAIAEQRTQFEAMQKALSPYVEAGNESLKSQQALSGLLGPEAQAEAVNKINQSPEMTAFTQQGENAILQNASATGGLRGGNVQSALAQFRPQLLSQLIDQQYSRLGGITGMGQASAAGVGQAGMQQGQMIGQLMQQQGANQAGGILGIGQGLQVIPNALSGSLGTYIGMGGKF